MTEQSAILEESSASQSKDGQLINSIIDSSFVEFKDGEVVASQGGGDIVVAPTVQELAPQMEVEELGLGQDGGNASIDVDCEQDDDLPPPPPPLNDDFPPPPTDLDIAVPAVAPEGSESTTARSSYAALVTPTGFISPTREDTDASRRSFTNRYL